MDNRGWKVLGKHTPLGFEWYDNIQVKDMFAIGDVVYCTGRAMLVMGNPYHRNGRMMVDVSSQYINASGWQDEVDETHQAFLAGTR